MRPEYRTNVGAILRRRDGHVLLCERIEPAGIWQFPQGGVEPTETLTESLWRELSEELGLQAPRDVLSIVGKGPPTTYDFPSDYDAPITRKYRGQLQTLYLMDFSGTDEDFQLDAHHEPEFRDFQWVELQAALDLIWEFKRPVLDATLEALSEHF